MAHLTYTFVAGFGFDHTPPCGQLTRCFLFYYLIYLVKCTMSSSVNLSNIRMEQNSIILYVYRTALLCSLNETGTAMTTEWAGQHCIKQGQWSKTFLLTMVSRSRRTARGCLRLRWWGWWPWETGRCGAAELDSLHGPVWASWASRRESFSGSWSSPTQDWGQLNRWFPYCVRGPVSVCQCYPALTLNTRGRLSDTKSAAHDVHVLLVQEQVRWVFGVSLLGLWLANWHWEVPITPDLLQRQHGRGREIIRLFMSVWLSPSADWVLSNYTFPPVPVHCRLCHIGYKVFMILVFCRGDAQTSADDERLKHSTIIWWWSDGESGVVTVSVSEPIGSSQRRFLVYDMWCKIQSIALLRRQWVLLLGCSPVSLQNGRLPLGPTI